MLDPTAPFLGYHTLMRRRVQDILLVASAYDCFILEEDGRFSHRLFSQYLELNLLGSPRFNQATSAKEALKQLRTRATDLVILTPHCVGMPPTELASAIKSRYPDIPVVMLAYDRATAQSIATSSRSTIFDLVALWTGDPKLLFALVKSVEDRWNVVRDTRKGMVRVLLLVEDSPAFYSSYLPILYTEVLDQTRSLMSEVLNEADRMYRMRARPKILLARTYEEGRDLLRKYRSNILGVVTDVQFPRKGRHDPNAGVALIKLMRRSLPYTPVLLQSAERTFRSVAEQLGVDYADKNSPELLAELREFMWTRLGFGPFVFRNAEGAEVSRAQDIKELVSEVARVPGSTIRYHAERHDFSDWLMARSLFQLAAELRTQKIDDFASTDETRQYLLDVLPSHMRRRQRGVVTEYVRGSDPLMRDFTRVGGGSMGGKARGIAFASAQLADHPVHAAFPNIRIHVPRTTVICTQVFDAFCDRGRLRERSLEAKSDVEIAEMFLAQPLGPELLKDLKSILADVRYPLAVRSSSLYEDSAFEPLAGLYKTIILPNCAPSDDERLDQLSRAIRLVFASTFFSGPRACMKAGSIRLEEEKMAVIIQRLVGSRHQGRFYPDFSGVVQSHNFYPVDRLMPEDGIATVALGLGQTVVEGGKAYRFCPRHPKVDFLTYQPSSALRWSQREFYALDLDNAQPELNAHSQGVDATRKYGLAEAERDGTLEAVGATYVPADDRIHDTIYMEGIRLVNFSHVLKYDRFALAPTLNALLEMGVAGLGGAVEMEFAVALDRNNTLAELAIVQLRPLVAGPILGALEQAWLGGDGPRLIAGPALGNGAIQGLQDVVYVHPDRFKPAQTRRMADEIAAINARLAAVGRPYILVAPGRWGTADPCLGIPVTWPQVSGTRVIVELAVPGFEIDPSLGTHFFHNITSLRVAYFTIDVRNEDAFIDLDKLESLPALSERYGIRHVELPEPFEARVDGALGLGAVVTSRSL